MGLTALPMVWAQASASKPGSFALLALRRWCASLTLSSPDPAPSYFGLWIWLLGLAALLVVALVMQGPVRALGQLFDLAGHVRLVSEALGRLRRAGRVVAVTIGITVVAWTAGQTLAFRQQQQGRNDLMLLTKSRSLGELGLEHGIMASLTPLRDLAGLGDNLLLLVIAAALAFRVSADRWANPRGTAAAERQRLSRWMNLAWMSMTLYAFYRLALLVAGSNTLLLGGCLMLEPVAVPLLMVLADGFLLGWVLVELRNASLGETGNETLDPVQAVGLMPGAALACVVALPARYVAACVLLSSLQLPNSANTPGLGSFVRWQLGWGLIDLQGVALTTVGLVGAVAWSRGTLGGAVRGYVRLLEAEAGHLIAVLALAGMAAGALAAATYLAVLALPPPELGPGGRRQLCPLRHRARRSGDPGRPGRAG